MSEAELKPLRVKIRRGLVQLHRFVNVVIPLVLGGLMLIAAAPRDRIPEAQRAQRDKLSVAMKTLSLSQNWGMYAPDAARSHFYLEFEAHDADGGVRLLDDGRLAQEDWGTVWAWKRTRKDIWEHAIGRHFDKPSRNRIWYLRGLCLREARRGYDLQQLEVRRVFRRIRSPERVREGAAALGPVSRRQRSDSSCNVRIIREMIAADRARRGLEVEGD